MNFIVYDLVLLLAFVIFISIFLYKRRKELTKEGWLLLYKTKWGMNIIEKVGKKYKKTLDVLGYISIAVGYALMFGAIYLVGKIVWLYIFQAGFVQATKIPPVMPLIPYIDKVAPSLGLPSFYFSYWIIILLVVATLHEFAHGIFMRRHGIKIKSTGFGFFPHFFPIFLAAFVEQDEKSMESKKIKPQLAVLSAGTFANLITAILGILLIWGFFAVAFVPAGAQFNSYSYSIVEFDDVISINNVSLHGISYEGFTTLANEQSFNSLVTENENYVGIKATIEENGIYYLALYDDAPAINANLSGAIVQINSEKITSWENLGEVLKNYSPGKEILIYTENEEGEILEQKIVLGENPTNSSKAWLGIGYQSYSSSGIMGKVSDFVTSFEGTQTYYRPRWEASEFIYNLLWWLVLICISVAIVNMLPVGIFDGGRFFYLTILGLTKSKKKAENGFKFMTWLFLAIVLLLMIIWAYKLFF